LPTSAFFTCFPRVALGLAGTARATGSGWAANASAFSYQSLWPASRSVCFVFLPAAAAAALGAARATGPATVFGAASRAVYARAASDAKLFAAFRGVINRLRRRRIREE